MIEELTYVVIAVPDLQVGARFYGGELGLVERTDGVSEPGETVFEVGPSLLALRLDPDAATRGELDGPIPTVDHLAFLVDSLDESWSILKNRDIDFYSEPMVTPSGHRNMQRALLGIRDPFGYVLQVSEMVDPRPEVAERRAAKTRMAESASVSGPFDGIDHISSYCSNFARTRSFYLEQLGLDEFFHSTAKEESTEVEEGFGQSAYALGGTDVELACQPSREIRPGPVVELGFRTSDVEGLYGDLKKNGCATESPPTATTIFGIASMSFTVCNPDGVPLRIFQPSPA